MIGVISDVHGNLPALEAVLADLQARGVERIWCLGDTVGYGPFVNECLQLVNQKCEVVLAGNHDLMARGELDQVHFMGAEGAIAGIRYATQHLTPESLQLLADLSPSRIMEQVELYHASANDPVWEYVRDERVAEQHLATQRLPLSLIGHSHLPLSFVQEAAGGRVQRGPSGDGASVPWGVGKIVVNPGSVGQPRDRNPRAAYAVVNATDVSFHRVSYDIGRMQKAVLAAGLPAESADRLELGW